MMLLENSSGVGCDANTELSSYTSSKHVLATVLVLLGSLCGSLLPIVSKYNARLREMEFVYTLGKCVAIGVVLVVALVHMMEPANEALTHPCAGEWLHEHGAPLAYALCAIAFCAVYTTELICSLHAQGEELHDTSHTGHSENDEIDINEDNNNSHAQLLSTAQQIRSRSQHTSTIPSDDHQYHHQQHNTHSHQHRHAHSHFIDFSSAPTSSAVTVVATITPHSSAHSDNSACVLINDNNLQVEHAKRVLSIIFFECGASIHSIFVGLAVGVCPDEELCTLTIAIVLHQFFEGIAIGASLVEASFALSLEAALAFVFTLSAPLGAVIAVWAMTQNAMNTEGTLYLRVQGVLNALCAGVLLYIGVSLLFVDFPRDMVKSVFAAKRPRLRQTSMIIAIWVGVAVMVILGWYA